MNYGLQSSLTIPAKLYGGPFDVDFLTIAQHVNAAYLLGIVRLIFAAANFDLAAKVWLVGINIQRKALHGSICRDIKGNHRFFSVLCQAGFPVRLPS